MRCGSEGNKHRSNARRTAEDGREKGCMKDGRRQPEKQCGAVSDRLCGETYLPHGLCTFGDRGKIVGYDGDTISIGKLRKKSERYRT